MAIELNAIIISSSKWFRVFPMKIFIEMSRQGNDEIKSAKEKKRTIVCMIFLWCSFLFQKTNVIIPTIITTILTSGINLESSIIIFSLI